MGGGRRGHVVWRGCGIQVGRTPILTAARFSQDDSVCLLLQHETDDDEMALEDFRLPDYVRRTPAACTRCLLPAAHATHPAPRASLFPSCTSRRTRHRRRSTRAVGMWLGLCGYVACVSARRTLADTRLKPVPNLSGTGAPRRLKPGSGGSGVAEEAGAAARREIGPSCTSRRWRGTTTWWWRCACAGWT